MWYTSCRNAGRTCFFPCLSACFCRSSHTHWEDNVNQTFWGYNPIEKVVRAIHAEEELVLRRRGWHCYQVPGWYQVPCEFRVTFVVVVASDRIVSLDSYSEHDTLPGIAGLHRANTRPKSISKSSPAQSFMYWGQPTMTKCQRAKWVILRIL